eukprot:73727_1
MPAPGVAKPLKHFYEVPRDLLSRKGIETRQHVHGLTGTLIVGDDTGLIKVVSCKKKQVIKVWGQQNPAKRIQKLYWAHPALTDRHAEMDDVYRAQKEFLAVLSNGDVRCFDSLVGSYKTVIKQETNITGLHVMHNPCMTENKKRMIWTVNEGGDMRLWAMDYNKKHYLDQMQNGEIEFPTDTMILSKLETDLEKHKKRNKSQNAFINLLKSQSKKNKDKSVDRGLLLSYFNVNTVLKKERLERQGKSTAQVNNQRKFDDLKRKRKNWDKIHRQSYGDNRYNVKCIKGHHSPGQFPWVAIGGDDRPVQVYDFNKQKCIFRGKHHYHWLGHKHKIIINDVDWAKKTVNPYLCAAVTSQSELKLYDIRAEKSMLAQKVGEYALTKVKIKSKKKVLIGDANSNVWEFDYLKPAKERGYVYRRYRGFVGAIKDFDVHPTRNLLASVCLGRYVVVHRFNQPHLPLFKTYLKQKLTSVLFGAQFDTKYLPKEEDKEQMNDKEDMNDDVQNFVNDSESEDNDEPQHIMDDDDAKDDDDEEETDLEHLKDKLDGYDTDELQDLLDELKTNKNDNNNSDEPPVKKKKISE